MDSDWIQELPLDLKNQIQAIIKKDETSLKVFTNLYKYLQDPNAKRRKIEQSPQLQHQEILDQSVIFKIPQVSFMSPLRKKMDLTLHLSVGEEPAPVLSIVNPATNIAEISFTDLKEAIKLCVILPIIGNSTNASKRGVCYFCFWIRDEYYPSESGSKDPVICQLNLDLIKKQLIKDEHIPANIESQYIHAKDSLVLHPVQENIVDFFKRQFELCGINIVNYLPGAKFFQNTYILNDFNALALKTNGSNTPAIVMVECHKGAKDGVLILMEENNFNPAYVIFGFKKPTLVFELPRIISASYNNITRSTFDMTIAYFNDRNETKNLELSVIDEKYFQIIDNFFKSHDISDASFNEGVKLTKTDSIEELAVVTNFAGPGEGGDDDDDDEEEDGDFEHSEGDTGSEVGEEFDSDAQSEPERDEEEEDGVFHRAIEID
ncbi:hypothetical protein SBY92_003415 [Candida maltosa Xu316]